MLRTVPTMSLSRCDCLCAGIIVADHVCAPIDHIPAPGELVLSPRMELTIGGCASNVAVDLAKLERHAALLGRVGRDVFGRTVREALEAAGVDCAQLVESQTAQTSGSFVINVRGEDRRFIHTAGANAEFTGAELTPERIQSARMLYLGGYCLSETLTADNVAAAFRMAREAGVTTVLDVVLPKPDDYWPMLRPVLPWTDVFLPNNDEAALITGLDDPLSQAVEFHRAGARTAVVTCGGRGAVLVGNGQRLRSSSFAVDYIDGTGSGDAFVAGYIHALLAGRDAADCLRWGSVLGASCVRKTGATTGVFTAEELQEFLRANVLPVESL
jgi:sugar/nucleoside kinase (ribokinase family)